MLIGYGYRHMFVASWEMAYARFYASPLVLAALLPVAGLLAAWSVWHERAPQPAARLLAAVVGLGAGAALALAPTGRLFGAPAARVVLGLVAGAGVSGLALVVLQRAARARRELVVGAAVVLAAAAWLLDALLFARQYPTLHALLAGFCVLGTSAAALGLARTPPKLRWAAVAFAACTWPWSVHAARALHRVDNLRLVLLEHAPLLGPGVALGARLVPVPAAASEELASPAAAGRTLHWDEKSVLLVTVDALRADHVSAYGYARPTTPHFDELARGGTLFEHAYCPTPHTSYSVTSLMTGKYMHPLRAMGLGEDSETWADLYRHYGYRTAGFYPPAVFFVDEDRFDTFSQRHLGFEYFKVEFAAPALRVQQVAEYLQKAPAGVPIFLWVHLFEPHEPYVFHPEHPFGDGPNPSALDAYDSEIAVADDTLGQVEKLFAASRPDHVLVVTADHGEEFDEHGGRYHGSSVYEEQVRVPLLVRGAGVKAGRVGLPVQTIDLLPTFLSAAGSPRPPRLRGRDLGPLLTTGTSADEGFAFAEVVPLAMVARGDDRLVCRRAENACALYDVASDPNELHDLGAERSDRVRTLRGLWQRTELDHGRLEGDRGSKVPPALRRGLQGDRDAAPEVAALLDDVDLEVRRTAARVLAKLAADETVPQLERSLGHETDPEVRGLLAAALTRATKTVHPDLPTVVTGTPEVARLIAMALAERGNPSRVDVLLDALEHDVKVTAGGGTNPDDDLDEDETIAIVRALEQSGGDPVAISRTLVHRLPDVRLRPHVVRALAKLGEPSSRAPLLEVFRDEQNIAVRNDEAEALLDLHASGEELGKALTRFAGMPEAMPDALALAERAHLATVPAGARTTWSGPAHAADVRVFVRLAASGTVDVQGRQGPSAVLHAVDAKPAGGEVHVSASAPIQAIWVVPLVPELPPPPAEEWDAGAKP